MELSSLSKLSSPIYFYVGKTRTNIFKEKKKKTF